MIKLAEKKALLKVINIIGNQTLLAQKLGITQQAVSSWLKKGIPFKYIITIEKIVKNQVTRKDLKHSFFDS